MTFNTGKKIRKIRESEGLGRKNFSTLTGISVDALIKVETSRSVPSLQTLHKVIHVFPQYTLWLMSNDNEEIKQKQAIPDLNKKSEELHRKKQINFAFK